MMNKKAIQGLRTLPVKEMVGASESDGSDQAVNPFNGERGPSCKTSAKLSVMKEKY